MTLKEHYKFHSRKSIKPYSSFFIFILLAFTAFYTFGRYNNTGTGSGDFIIAKWAVTVNGEALNSDTNELSSTMQLINSNDGTTYLNKGDECYFDIEIDPSTTEVSVDYSILIDLTEGDHPLPTGSTISRYEVFEGESQTASNSVSVGSVSTNITGTISLINNQALNSDSIRKFRIYCSIPSNATIEDGEEFNVNPTIAIGQSV